MTPVPFCVPFRAPNEQSNIAEALDAGVKSGDGVFSARCRVLLTEIAGGGTPFLTTSGTAALELAMLVAGIGPGDEVIIPSFTFTSVANAVVLRGAIPVFVDIEAATLNIDPRRIAEAIGPRTRAMIVVHYAGVVCDMERICEMARQRDIVVIEDAAHAIGSHRDGRSAGSFGDLAAFSFHYTKNITCGEGGALIVNAPELVPRAEVAFDKGTNRSRFMKGLVDKYSWIDAGASFTLSELNAAMLAAQLEALATVNSLRMSHWLKYRQRLRDLAGIELPPLPEGGHNAHLFYFLLPSERLQERFISTMGKQGINTPFHYVPLHSSPAGQKFGRVEGPTRVTDSIWNRLVRLPLYPSLGADGEHVARAVEVAIGEIV